jgi:two-component system, sensor histidine kinase
VLSAPSEFARSALDAAPDAILIIDATGCIEFANRQVSALFGYAHDEIIGQRVEQLLPERFRARHVGHRKDYVSALRWRPMGAGLQLFGRRRDGSEFPVEISLSPIQNGDRVLVAAAIRDVTDRKIVEAELIAARELADHAHALADEARISADRANQGKSRFLATASHDLRQPLQTLALLNGTLRRMITDANCAQAVAQQEQAISAMSRLLNALLDISKLESGAIKPEPTDFTVAALFEDLRAEFATLAASKGLGFEIDSCTDCVHSDPSLVEEILRNLVSNAIKYTRVGWVKLRCLQDATLVRIEVLDTGVGIAGDQIPLIFDEFYQVGVPTNASRDGYGLGLSIVHRMVKLLALKLDVHSELGKGSAFSLALPASKRRTVPAQFAAEAAHSFAQQTERRQVLLVEDDPAVRAATRMLLGVEGFLIADVATLAEALQYVSAHPDIDVLITDYHLRDGETGIEVIAAVREKLGTQLKTVMMTGDTSSAMKDLACDPHLRILSKPFKAEQLLSLIRALLAA